MRVRQSGQESHRDQEKERKILHTCYTLQQQKSPTVPPPLPEKFFKIIMINIDNTLQQKNHRPPIPSQVSCCRPSIQCIQCNKEEQTWKRFVN